MAANRRLAITLNGPPSTRGQVDFGDFVRFCRELISCLKAIDDAISPDEAKTHYVISNLKTGSAVVEIEKKGKGPARAIGAFQRMAKDLASGTKLDKRITGHVLESVRRLGTTSTQFEAAWVDNVSFGKEMVTAIDRVMAGGCHSLGHVSGRLDAINVHKKRECTVYPTLGGQVRCSFSDDLRKAVIDAIGHHVTVTGMLSFLPEHFVPYKVEIHTLDVHEPDAALPKLSDLRGVLSESLQGVDPVEFARSIRDE